VVATLQRLIAAQRATDYDREYAYRLVQKHPANSAETAFAHAAVAGRLAQIRGMRGGSLVEEVERYARLSLEYDPAFQQGAAQRMLGTLYVLAPAMFLKHGDSETGLELLEELVEKYPHNLSTHLRVAEAYLALDDYEPATPHLCFCLAQKKSLRADEQRLLTRLVEEAELSDCPESIVDEQVN
jgi:predicted Zn-dependent protease